MANITRQELLEWMRERKQNCILLANQKTGEDRDGWLDDAAHFEAAVLDLEYLDRNRLRRTNGNKDQPQQVPDLRERH